MTTTAGKPVETDTRGTLEAVARFSRAFARRDLPGALALVTDDCVFESTAPPDGQRYEGREQVAAAWAAFFAASPSAEFETEEVVALGDRAAARWRYSWRGQDGRPGHVRGVDLLRVRDGRVAEKLSYVKG